jgi:hypothetical protein
MTKGIANINEINLIWRSERNWDPTFSILEAAASVSTHLEYQLAPEMA